ncbi:MAG: DUF4974 domain-containing protein [Muribaculaceae bacterium]|nr:DUF4974 domain-containing protein [Muribaculaceae bacterium]
MDKHESKYDTVFDIIDHPEKYPVDRLNEILSDPETREIYNLLCKADSAIEANEAAKEVDVNAEWDDFSRKHSIRRRSFFTWFGSRAASIAVIICTSLVAVAAGIAVTVAVMDHKSEPVSNKEIKAETSATEEVSKDTTVQTDTIEVPTAPVMFENEPLETIMKTVAAVYNVEVKFNNEEAANLHLYYKLNPSLPLDEVVSQLNTFEQINITRNGNILTID